MPERKCTECGADIENKKHRFIPQDMIFPKTCANCDYERALKLEKDAKSAKALREAAALFRTIGDYLDAPSHAAHCEALARFKMAKKMLLIYAFSAVVIVVSILIFTNLPMFLHILDFKKNTKKVVVYEDGDMQYVVLPYADNKTYFGLSSTTKQNTFWVQPNGDCIVMFSEEIGDSIRTRFYRYNSDWKFQNELAMDVSFIDSGNTKRTRRFIWEACQTNVYGNYSPVLGVKYIDGDAYNIIVSYDEQTLAITPIQTFYPEKVDPLFISMTQICSIADTYLVFWEPNNISEGAKYHISWLVVLQDENNLIRTFSRDDMESIAQSQFNLTYNSTITINITADDSFYYIYSWFDYTDNGEKLSDALLITLDRFGNMESFLLSSMLQEFEGMKAIPNIFGDYSKIYYDSISDLLKVSLAIKDENGDMEMVDYQYEPKAHQMVRLVEQNETSFPQFVSFYSRTYPNRSIYSLTYLYYTPFYEEYRLRYLWNQNAECRFNYVIVVDKNGL